MSSARPWAELEERAEVAGVREKAALTPNKARASLSAPRTAKNHKRPPALERPSQFRHTPTN